MLQHQVLSLCPTPHRAIPSIVPVMGSSSAPDPREKCMAVDRKYRRLDRPTALSKELGDASGAHAVCADPAQLEVGRESRYEYLYVYIPEPCDASQLRVEK